MQAGVSLPSTSEAELRKTVFRPQYADLNEYLAGFMYTTAVMKTAAACERARLVAQKGEGGSTFRRINTPSRGEGDGGRRRRRRLFAPGDSTPDLPGLSRSSPAEYV